ncbi:MAG TPA: septal ring lytic transglycosylase RlpA family protein [Pseudolabrys sp.]|jgi:rare lipoprotein A|nr:septal ring lytic transglycosylase RlpA family protein [Pseudolabrys sp.]
MATAGVWFAATVALAICTAIGTASARDRTSFSGKASYYDKNYHGKVASGAQYQPELFTCAHQKLPFGTRLRVTDPKTHRSVTVTVNDRGPFTQGRILDLSLAAARALKMIERGVIQVSAEIEPNTHAR